MKKNTLELRQKCEQKIITYPKFIISISLTHFLSSNVKWSQMWAECKSFLPYKILKASRVCKSRLLAIPWFCLRSSVTHERDQQQRFQNARFLQAKVPLFHFQQALSRPFCFWLGIRLRLIFGSTPLTKALQTQPKLVQENLLKLRNLVNGKLSTGKLADHPHE